MAISEKSIERARLGLKRLIPVIQSHIECDVSEADTVTLVKEVFSDVFGFDKFFELSSETAICNDRCDIAVKLDGKMVEIAEVKSAATGLKEHHVTQVVNYAANAPVDWVVLTNGSIWRLYRVLFEKPIDKILLHEIDLTTISLKGDDFVNDLAPFMKEGFSKDVQQELYDRIKATDPFLLSALVFNNDAVIATIRRELRKIMHALVNENEIRQVLQETVIKPEFLVGPDAEAATRKVKKAMRSQENAAPSPVDLSVPKADTDSTPHSETGISSFAALFATRNSILKDELYGKLINLGLTPSSASSYISWAKRPLTGLPDDGSNPFGFQLVESKDEHGNKVLHKLGPDETNKTPAVPNIATITDRPAAG